MSAYVYLITWFLSENCKQKDTKEANLTKGKRRVAKKDRTDDQEKQEVEMNAILVSSQDALKLFVEGILSKDIHLLWPEQKIEEDFIKSFLKCGFDLLEHHGNTTKVVDFK